MGEHAVPGVPEWKMQLMQWLMLSALLGLSVSIAARTLTVKYVDDKVRFGTSDLGVPNLTLTSTYFTVKIRAAIRQS